VKRRRYKSGPISQLLFFALLFFGGVLLGEILSRWAPNETGRELNHYLTGYFFLNESKSVSLRHVIATILLYLRYPVAAFFLGFSSVGVILLPLLTVVFGIFLSFSVCCLTAAFGAQGVLLALTVFGMRCLVTLPGYFYLALPAWRASAALAAILLGRRNRPLKPIGYSGTDWHRLGVVLFVLVIVLCVDLALSPLLLQIVLDRLI